MYRSTRVQNYQNREGFDNDIEFSPLLVVYFVLCAAPDIKHPVILNIHYFTKEAVGLHNKQ